MRNQSRITSGRAVVAAVMATVSILGVTMRASATVLPRETFGDDVAYEYSDCGYPIDVRGTFEGSVSLRVGKNGDESMYFIRESVAFREVHTNRITGEWFVVRGKTTFLETRATRFDRSLFEVRQIQVGVPYVIEDSSGRVVLRDRGAVQYRVVLDTGGDSDPGRELAQFLSFDVRGPHPSIGADICAVAGDLVPISDSSARFGLRPAGTTGAPLGYAEYLPPGYAADGSSPLLVFLHGSGESGDGTAEKLTRLTQNALPSYIQHNGWPADRPFVVLAPQHEDTADPDVFGACETAVFFGSCALSLQHDVGNPTPGSPCFTPAEVDAFLDYAVDAYGVDPQRVYLTGLSCGGYGVWEYLAEHGGEHVAAAVPIAGEGRPASDSAGCALGDTPIWAFHGADDDLVDPAGSVVPIASLQGCVAPVAADARVTVYPGVDHDSWTPTYALESEHDIYAWMLSHRLA